MSELTTEMCAFPGCERPVAPAGEGAGRPSRYCETPGHNAQSAFRERRRRAAAGELDGSDGAEQGGGDRPVSLAGATLRAVAARLIGGSGAHSRRARRVDRHRAARGGAGRGAR